MNMGKSAILCSAIYLLIGCTPGQADDRVGNENCKLIDYGFGSQVCLCCASHCGALYVPDPATLFSKNGNDYVLYTTSKAGLRFHPNEGLFVDVRDFIDDIDVKTRVFWQNGGEIVVDPKTKYQEILGFGGSLTDSAAMNINSMKEDVQDTLIKLMFSDQGNNYNLVRVPIGGTDDSTRKYTYADNPNDLSLQNFRLAEEDLKYKIPAIRRASQVSGRNLSLIGSAWTAPPWMKSNNKYVNGVLKAEYYQLWADYHMKFLEEYAKNNISFWALTTGNEPINGYAVYFVRFNSMGWNPWSHRKWLGHYLGPTLRSSAFNKTLILAHDDQRFLLPWWMDEVMRDELAASYIDGIAVHWYWDILDPAVGLDATHNHFPTKFILSSEASNADKPWHFQKVRLGSWTRATKYMTDIIKDLSHWVTGWMEWSMVLDTAGGPSWSGNYVDVGIIVNASSQEILLQPAYFALGHFSRFVAPGSKRVAVSGSPRGVDYVGFLTPDDQIVVVLHNREGQESVVTVRHPGLGRAVLLLPPNSFNTLVYTTKNNTTTKA